MASDCLTEALADLDWDGTLGSLLDLEPSADDSYNLALVAASEPFIPKLSFLSHFSICLDAIFFTFSVGMVANIFPSLHLCLCVYLHA